MAKDRKPVVAETVAVSTAPIEAPEVAAPAAGSPGTAQAGEAIVEGATTLAGVAAAIERSEQPETVAPVAGEPGRDLAGEALDRALDDALAAPRVIAPNGPTQASIGAAPTAAMLAELPANMRGQMGLRVTSAAERGFWRLGRHFTATPVVIALASLTEEEIDVLANERMLSVALVPIEPASI